jgi:citryl-CoA lyase
MKWKTAISTRTKKDFYIRSKGLLMLIEKHSFTDVIFLLLRERLPTKKESSMLNAVLVACAEHGIETPSAFTARVSQSVGNSLPVAIAAGILATGQWHGGAVNKAMELFESGLSQREIVSDLLKRKERMPGFGHKLYKDKDPRAQALLSKARKLGLAMKYVPRAVLLEKELARQSGKMLPLNVDGALAAVLLELGFSSALGNSLFVIGRVAGLTAHAFEELSREKPYRRLDENDVEYDGKPPRD